MSNKLVCESHRVTAELHKTTKLGRQSFTFSGASTGKHHSPTNTETKTQSFTEFCPDSFLSKRPCIDFVPGFDEQVAEPLEEGRVPYERLPLGVVAFGEIGSVCLGRLVSASVAIRAEFAPKRIPNPTQSWTKSLKKVRSTISIPFFTLFT